MVDNRYPGDTQFAGLVEAATAAADQEMHWSANAEPMNPDARHAYAAYEARAPLQEPYGPVTTGQYSDPVDTEPAEPSTRKRKRDIEISQDHHAAVDGVQASDYDAAPNAPHASVAGISAAAIFRQPSTISKKYTRPPIGKLYSSLELSPENFIHLQNAAKEYMLDKNHPERLDTIGQRGRGDTDLVKLKLWNFVREFLDDLGNGQEFFGEHVLNVEGQEPRTMIWPQDAEQIIKACVPVLRRMVTNERQRKYAMHARKTNDDVRGLESRKERRVARSTSSKAVRPPTLHKADALELEIADLLDDACVPGCYEAADWYSEHERHPNLHNGLLASGLDERDYRILVANVDGHYRLFHDGDVSQCKKDCEAQAIERLLSWDRLFSADITSDIRERQSRMDQLMQQLFGLVKDDLQTKLSTLGSEVLPQADSRAKDSGARHDSVGQDESARNSTPLARGADPKRPSKKAAETSGGALELHVNLVATDSSATLNPTFRSVKRLADPFSLPALSVPNLQALRSEVEKHFGKTLQALSPTDASGASRLGKVRGTEHELLIKVWLPDGLVRVRDDGEWMVALLSAELVEWMDKQVKILVEILT